MFDPFEDELHEAGALTLANDNGIFPRFFPQESEPGNSSGSSGMELEAKASDVGSNNGAGHQNDASSAFRGGSAAQNEECDPWLRTMEVC